MFHNIPGKYPLLRAHVWGRTGGKRGRNAPTALYTRSEAGGNGAPQSPLPAAVRPMVPPQPAPGAPRPAPTPLRVGSAAAPSGLSGVPLVAGFPPKWWRRGGQGWMPPSGGTVPRAGERQHGALRPLPARPLPAGGIRAPRTGAGPAAPRMRLGSGGHHPARVGGCPSVMPLPASPHSAPGAPDPRSPAGAPHSPGATPRSPAAAPSPRRQRGCPLRRVPAGAHLQGCSHRVPRAVSARPPSPCTFKNFEFGIQNRAGQSGTGSPATQPMGKAGRRRGPIRAAAGGAGPAPIFPPWQARSEPSGGAVARARAEGGAKGISRPAAAPARHPPRAPPPLSAPRPARAARPPQSARRRDEEGEAGERLAAPVLPALPPALPRRTVPSPVVTKSERFLRSRGASGSLMLPSCSHVYVRRDASGAFASVLHAPSANSAPRELRLVAGLTSPCLPLADRLLLARG